MVHRGPQRGGEWGALWGDLRHMGRVRIDGFSDRFQDRRSREEEARDGGQERRGGGRRRRRSLQGEGLHRLQVGGGQRLLLRVGSEFFGQLRVGTPGMWWNFLLWGLWTGWWKQR